MAIRKQSILNPKTSKAHEYWYSLTPRERGQLMKEANLKNKSILGKFREIISYIEENIL